MQQTQEDEELKEAMKASIAELNLYKSQSDESARIMNESNLLHQEH